MRENVRPPGLPVRVLSADAARFAAAAAAAATQGVGGTAASARAVTSFFIRQVLIPFYMDRVTRFSTSVCKGRRDGCFCTGVGDQL